MVWNLLHGKGRGGSKNGRQIRVSWGVGYGLPAESDDNSNARRKEGTCSITHALSPSRRNEDSLASGGAESQWRSFKSRKLKQSPRCWFMVEKQLLGVSQIHCVFILFCWYSDTLWNDIYIIRTTTSIMIKEDRCTAYLQRLSFVANEWSTKRA